ncbi:ABC transporter substrate-binding protein [Saccharibacillus sacchari]|uniref:ABC transporter substrate-binding protein n=1 Tax=Saccharibacillus sacchari TaxID=456493 RepID=A0ACC6PHG3_9BACL
MNIRLNKKSAVPTVGCALLLSFALSACGSDSSVTQAEKETPVSSTVATSTAVSAAEAAAPADSQTKTEAEAAAKTDTRTVEYLGRSYTVPVEPQKIIFLNAFESMEDAVVLGVQPYASSAIGDEDDPFPGFYSPLGDTAIPLFGSGSDSMEYLLSLSPDLIIATDMEEDAVIEQLGLIAPTIQVSHFGTDWEANLNLLAELTGKQAEAKQAIERYEEGKKRLNASLADYEGQDILAIRVRGGEMMVYPEDVFLNDVLYGELALPVPALIKRTSEQQPIGLEGLYAENPDYIFLQYDLYENNESNETLRKLQESNVWKGLKAVQNGQVFINAIDPLVSGGTAYGKQEILSAVEDKLGTP